MKTTKPDGQRQEIPTDVIAAVLAKRHTSKTRKSMLKEELKNFPRGDKNKFLLELKILWVIADIFSIDEIFKKSKIGKAIFTAYMGFLMHESNNIFKMKPKELSLILKQRIETYEKAWATAHSQGPFYMIGKAFTDIVGHPSAVICFMGSVQFSGAFIYSPLRKYNEEYEIKINAQ